MCNNLSKDIRAFEELLLDVGQFAQDHPEAAKAVLHAQERKECVAIIQRNMEEGKQLAKPLGEVAERCLTGKWESQ